MSEFRVQKGATGPIIEVYADIMTDTVGWTCRQVLKHPDGTVVIDRAVTAKNEANDKFVAYISENDTDNLAIEIYSWEITLENQVFEPAFEATEFHSISIEPANDDFSNQVITRGGNSFGTYQDLLEQLSVMPMLSAAKNADRLALKSMAIQAWRNMGNLVVNFDNGLYTTREFDAAVLDALEPEQRQKLLRAQMIETDFLLGGNPVEHRRRMGLMSDSVGESAQFMRPTKPVILAVCRDCALALTPYVVHSTNLAR